MASQVKVVVDNRFCEGHALCVVSAPSVFDLTADDIAECVAQPPDSVRDEVRAAVDACPRGAISIIDA